MTDKEQIESFADDINKLVDRYRSEYDMSYASVVGTLQMKIILLCDETTESDDD